MQQLLHQGAVAGGSPAPPGPWAGSASSVAMRSRRGRRQCVPPLALRPSQAMGREPCGCTARLADGRLRPGHGPAAGCEGVPVTRRLLVVVAVVAVMLGLVAAPALDETAVGGWFGLPWDGSRGLDQPGQQGEPTASSPTTNRGAETSATGVRMPDPIRVVTAPNSGAPRASQTRPGGRPGRRRETCMRAHGQLAGNPQLGQREATARSASCRRLLDAIDPATAPAGASGSTVADAPALRQVPARICTGRGT
jgi:hypothetical protein